MRRTCRLVLAAVRTQRLGATGGGAPVRRWASGLPESSGLTVGFVGLGAMGSQMAANLAEIGGLQTRVWDMQAAAVADAEVRGCAGMPDAAGAVDGADLIFTSLPRSADVEALVESLATAGALKPGAVWVDTTSGVPDLSQRIYAKLKADCSVAFLDCGVAGGPAGARAGTLAAMAGGDADALALALPAMNHIMGNIVHVGPSGAGHAVKSVNNTLLAAHIWVAYEGLITLAKLGVPMETALDAINAASGRSLVTEERIPKHVLSRGFDFGFALDLMRKDIGITMDTLTTLDIPAPVLRQVNEMFAIGEAKLGPKAEHMEVVKVLEEMVGVEIRSSKPPAEP